jgi:hypothetical protein
LTDPYFTGSSRAFAHTFAGTAGQRILLTMTSASFSPTLHLVGPDGREITPERNELVSGTRRMIAVLPASGPYSIEAGNDWSDGFGAYALSLTDLANDLIFADDFESGDLSRWSSSSTKAGKLSVRDVAARLDTGGLHFDVTDLPPPSSRAKLWVKDTSPDSESHYRARFFLDLNDLTVPTASRTLRLMAARTASDPSARPFELRLVYEDGIWNLVGIARDNSGTVAYKTDAVSIPRSWVQVVVEWKAASGPGSNDGFLVLAVDGSMLVGAGKIPNDQIRIEGVQLGLLGGVGLSSTGSMFIDDFESRREGPFSSPYGPPAAAFLGGSSGALTE